LGFEVLNAMMGRFPSRLQRGTGSAVFYKQLITHETKEFQLFHKEISETPWIRGVLFFSIARIRAYFEIGLDNACLAIEQELPNLKPAIAAILRS
jgi:hypothetical protein